INFHSSKRFVVNGSQSKCPQIEVGSEFAIDSLQFVDDERASDAQWIVVSSFKDTSVFFQIRAEQQRVAFTQDASDRAEKNRGLVWLKIANIRTKEQNQRWIGGG